MSLSTVQRGSTFDCARPGRWSAAPTFSSQWLTAQIRLPKLCYSYIKLTVVGIEPTTFRLKGECSTDCHDITGINMRISMRNIYFHIYYILFLPDKRVHIPHLLRYLSWDLIGADRMCKRLKIFTFIKVLHTEQSCINKTSLF